MVDTGVDELTGVNNRRRFFELGLEAFREARESGTECTAAIIDLDRLALLSETFGDDVATDLICKTADALKAIARKGDIIGRLGDDEFALLRLGSGTSSEDLAAQIAERSGGDDQLLALDVSVGVAVEPADELDSLDELMWLADEAMYEQKQAGGGSTGAPHARRRARD